MFMVGSALQRSLKSPNWEKNKKTWPEKFTLNGGHVKFFYDKFTFLYERHKKITQELLCRGYELSHTDSSVFLSVPTRYLNDYTPTEEAIRLNRERIKIRLPKKPKYKKGE